MVDVIYDDIANLLARVSEAEVEENIARLEREIQALREEQEKWLVLRTLKHRVPGGTAQPSASLGSVLTSRHHLAGEDGAGPTLREGILLVMSEEQLSAPLKLSRLRDHLISRGWLGRSEGDAHRLQVMASDMVKRGQLERPEIGFYKLPRRAPTTGDGRERSSLG